MGISTTVFMIQGVFIVTLRVLKTIYRGDDYIEEWEEENRVVISTVSTLLNIFIGYLFQNLAYLSNIYRWKLLTASIKLQSAGNSSKSITEDDLQKIDL